MLSRSLTRPARPTALAAAALAAFALLGLAACGSDSADVASLAEEKAKAQASEGASAEATTKAPQQMTQAEVTELMVACLKKEDIPAMVQDWGDGQADVGFDSEDFYQICIDNGCSMSGGSSDVSQTEAEFEAAWQKYDQWQQQYNTETGEMQPTLFIGDTDWTKEWRACLAETGWTSPVYQESPEDELKAKQQQAAVATEWASCARANGVPEVKDPTPPVADGWQTTPMALLPTSITEERLRALLEACPTFDPAAIEAFEAAYEEFFSADQDPSEAEVEEFFEEHTYPETPRVGFDAPGWNGDYSGGYTEDEILSENLIALEEVLHEAENTYYMEQYGEGAVGAGGSVGIAVG
ncbi:MAG: hypothetical protein LBR27_03585 [Bifidobacteriaceae bacterium]|jgi:hypothetical protein|nr:hypothetical protein [Bifidobacteriaceae bacterium]